MNVLTKNELIDIVAVEANTTKAEVRRLLKTLSNVTATALKEDKVVVVGDLGRMHPVVRAKRTARNMHTGELIEVPSRKAVKFVASKGLNIIIGK